MRLMSKLISIIFISLFFLSISPVYAATRGTTYSENRQTILVSARNPYFSIVLKSNPSTGFKWFLRDYNPYLLIAFKQGYIKARGKIGAPGYQVWSFKVRPNAFYAPQSTNVRFVYIRSGGEIGKKAIFRVIIVPAYRH